MKPTSWHRCFPTIRSRLLAMLAGCVLLPAITGQLWMHLVTRQSLVDSQIQKYHSLATQAARQVTAQMQFSLRNLNTLSSNHLLKGPGTEEAGIDAIRQISEAGKFWSDISLFNHDGDLLASSSNDYTEPQERTEWFKRAAEGATVISTPQMFLSRRGHLDLAIYHPLEDPKTRRKLIVRGRIPFDAVSSMLSDVDLGGGHLALLDGAGNTLYQRDLQKLQRRAEGVAAEAFTRSESQGLSREADGREAYWIAHRLGPERTCVDDSWTLVAVIPRDQITAYVNQRSIMPLGASLATLFVITGLGYGVSRRITRPTLLAAGACDRSHHSKSGATDPRRHPLHHQPRVPLQGSEPEPAANQGE